MNSVTRYHKFHAPGSTLVKSLLSSNEVDSKDNEKTNSNVHVQDPADNEMPILTNIIEFLDSPLQEKIKIEVV